MDLGSSEEWRKVGGEEEEEEEGLGKWREVEESEGGGRWIQKGKEVNRRIGEEEDGKK